MPLLQICRQCRPSVSRFAVYSAPASSRQFSASQALLARRVKKSPGLTKKALAAKANKKKARRNIFESEKMTLAEAVNVLRAVEVGSSNAMYELTVKTAMPRGSAIPKGRITLPREPKAKEKDRILVFAEGRAAEDAKKAGADIVGGAELVDGVVSGRHQATLILCTPALIRSITPRLGRILGPRGLMPSERRGTVTDDVSGFIRRLQGTNEWKGDKAGTIRAPIAKLDFPIEDVVKNVRHFLGVVKRATGNQRDLSAQKNQKKGNAPVNAITRVILSSRQGPGIQVSDI
ncbi:ribosomal protein L1 [Artomyces pyxidatus]|uniref:Ribosomal protein L1 n=1 Tax=Artomyces pyxidatus TaxID=48021 RepID=A0ACB8THV5_9AGAM|nr:ribosomal protein L1 [Artomyces pyxidatus]